MKLTLPLISGQSTNGGAPFPGPSTSAVASCVASAVLPRGVKRKATDQCKDKEKLDAAFARAMYASGMPFSKFVNPYWNEFYTLLRPGYKLPKPRMISNRLLDKEYRYCREENRKIVKDARFIGIMANVFTDVRQDFILDVIVTTPKPVLLKECRATGRLPVGRDLLNIIKEIGPQKVWLLVTADFGHAQIIEDARRAVVEQFPHITAVDCASHFWDHLIKDLIQVPGISRYIGFAADVVDEFRGSGKLAAAFKAKQKEMQEQKGIVMKTLKPHKRKATSKGAVMMLQSVIDNEAALQAAQVILRDSDPVDALPVAIETESDTGASSPEIITLSSLETTASQDSVTSQASVITLVSLQSFWNCLKRVADLISPIHKAIQSIEDGNALLSDVYDYYRRIKSCMAENLKNLDYLDEKEEHTVVRLTERLDHFVQPIHMAAYLLDPRYRGADLDVESVEAALGCIRRLAGLLNLNENNVINNVLEFRSQSGFYSKVRFYPASHTPAAWWRDRCKSQKVAQIAEGILCMPPSAAECKRRWEEHGFIHSMARNRLSRARATKLALIRANLVSRLITEREDSQKKITDFFAPV